VREDILVQGESIAKNLAEHNYLEFMASPRENRRTMLKELRQDCDRVE